MFIGKTHELSRRAFLVRSGRFAALGSASAYALGLAGIGEAAAFSSADDYKALVCVFLYGGNDHMNTVVPYDPVNFQRYKTVRQSIALERSDLVKTVLSQTEEKEQQLTNDITYALHPSLPKLSARFREGRMAVLLNVGPLVAPITRAQWESGDTKRYPRPKKLFSHNDQREIWQTSGVESSQTGWGGRLADLAQTANANAMFTAINAAGNAVFLTGEQSSSFRVSPRGAELVSAIESGRLFRSTEASEALRKVMTTHHQHALERDYAEVVARSLTYSPFIDGVLSDTTSLGSADNEGELASQLQTVARLIMARDDLGVKRQVFFVGLGGFDHHSDLIGRHAPLLAELDDSLDSFYKSMEEIGVASNVTAFTASDFGRTFTPNGNGSDHGWGGHSFILGGAVRGGMFYGAAPEVSVTSDDQVGRGRLLPSTSVDEFAATFAQWFGVGASELASVLPNISRFARPNLGFMKS